MSLLPSESPLPRGLVESWRADTASPAELRRGYGRFLRAKERPSPARLLGRWIVLGVVLGGGLAQGATLLAEHWHPTPVRPLLVAASPAPKPSASPVRSVPRAPVAVQTPALEAPSPPVPHAPVRALPVATEAPSLASPLSARVFSERWQQAAAAMRVHDFATADSALRELEVTTQGSERDAVLVTRAQLLASVGRNGEALALARRVQEQSSSSRMRDKASELVSRLVADLPDRSALPSGAINTP